MAKIKFENGTVVNFDGTPTQQDVEEVANKLGLNKKQPLYGNQQEMASKLAAEKKVGEKAGKATLGGVIKGLPAATAAYSPHRAQTIHGPGAETITRKTVPVLGEFTDHVKGEVS